MTAMLVIVRELLDWERLTNWNASYRQLGPRPIVGRAYQVSELSGWRWTTMASKNQWDEQTSRIEILVSANVAG
jgi:hypothetical protein